MHIPAPRLSIFTKFYSSLQTLAPPVRLHSGFYPRLKHSWGPPPAQAAVGGGQVFIVWVVRSRHHALISTAVKVQTKCLRGGKVMESHSAGDIFPFSGSEIFSLPEVCADGHRWCRDSRNSEDTDRQAAAFTVIKPPERTSVLLRTGSCCCCWHPKNAQSLSCVRLFFWDFLCCCLLDHL